MLSNYKPIKTEFEDGSVIIAGAGPGSVKLLTYRVLNILMIADVVIYDALVNKEILKYCKKYAKLIFAGKLKNKKACSQNDINLWLVKYAKKGNKVLRLKGGDPSFFSRVSQESEYLKNNKIKFKVFSGITASQESIKKLNSNFFNDSHICNLITGHKSINYPNVDINFKSICSNNGRIIIYMGIGQLEKISCKLIENGKSKDTKVSIIYNASLENEKIWKLKLGNLKNLKKKADVKSPAIIVVD